MRANFSESSVDGRTHIEMSFAVVRRKNYLDGTYA